ncbi:MAG: FecR family protein, partial [bacterium]
MEQPDYYNLIRRKLSGEITATEESALESWLRASAENRQIFNDLQKILLNVASPLIPEPENIDRQWLRLQNTLGLNKPVEKIKPARLAWNIRKGLDYLTNVRPQFRPAFAVLAAIFVIATALYIWQTGVTPKQYQEIVTLNAQQKEITLPDGSRIHLNSGSSLKFLPAFDDSIRQVRLAGEAFFEVAKAPRPFVALTEQALTRVLGTKFNVWARQVQTRVIVQEGRVGLRSAQLENDAGVVLAASEMSECHRGEKPSPPQAIDARLRLGWLENKLVFVKTPLSEIVAELERFYNIPVQLADSSLAKTTVTGTFQNQPLSSILSAICWTLNLQYTKTANG